MSQEEVVLGDNPQRNSSTSLGSAVKGGDGYFTKGPWGCHAGNMARARDDPDWLGSGAQAWLVYGLLGVGTASTLLCAVAPSTEPGTRQVHTHGQR